MKQFIASFSSQPHNYGSASSKDGLLPSPSALPTAWKASATFLPLDTFSLIGMPSDLSSGNTLVSSESWVLDSGATHHVCHDKTLFNIPESLLNTFVTLSTGNFVRIIGIGPIKSDNPCSKTWLTRPRFRRLIFPREPHVAICYNRLIIRNDSKNLFFFLLLFWSSENLLI